MGGFPCFSVWFNFHIRIHVLNPPKTNTKLSKYTKDTVAWPTYCTVFAFCIVDEPKGVWLYFAVEHAADVHFLWWLVVMGAGSSVDRPATVTED